jgi:hypothetical protein
MSSRPADLLDLERGHDQPARRPPTQGRVGESWHHPTDIPAQPAEPGGLPNRAGYRARVMASLGLLTAVLALADGLAVLAVWPAGRRARVRHAA